ncbi:hypothetical protein Q8F55_008806 [Vanrija albida]|uniref:Mediator complex subunit 9 n=1 Tax=Vanrija albida TaxID=181172 RepID=A0ABR3PS69_9TREE
MAGTQLPPPASGPSSAQQVDAVPALAPGTFSSILPALEDVLELVFGIAEGADIKTEDVAGKAKELAAQLAAMKRAAAALPGGHLGAGAVDELTRVLEEQAARRRAVLRAFADSPTPAVDAEAGRGAIAENGPTPAREVEG